MQALITGLLVIGIVLSLRMRKNMVMWRSQPISSPLSKAIIQLVGTAGGIYISLELLLDFLGIPEKLWNPPSFYFVKPLAVFSLLIAILQPYGLKLWLNFRKRRG